VSSRNSCSRVGAEEVKSRAGKKEGVLRGFRLLRRGNSNLHLAPVRLSVYGIHRLCSRRNDVHDFLCDGG
jgi:hypothetical protein